MVDPAFSLLLQRLSFIGLAAHHRLFLGLLLLGLLLEQLLLLLLSQEHLLDLRLGQLVLVVIFNVLLTALDLNVAIFILNDHFARFNVARASRLLADRRSCSSLDKLKMLSQLVKVILSDNLLKLLPWERELVRILFILLL